MSLPVIVLGAGGHAKVLVDALRRCEIEVLGATDADPEGAGAKLPGVAILGTDAALAKHPPSSVLLAIGLGSIRPCSHRAQLFDQFKRQGYEFATVIHPSAVVANDVVLSEGAQIMAGAIVQVGSRIGKNAIVNTRAAIDHDCVIGDHAHVAPGVTLSGAVQVGENAHIGVGATVIQGIRIGRNALVAAGAVVVKDVGEGAAVAGVPASEMDQ